MFCQVVKLLDILVVESVLPSSEKQPNLMWPYAKELKSVLVIILEQHIYWVHINKNYHHCGYSLFFNVEFDVVRRCPQLVRCHHLILYNARVVGRGVFCNV